jgi:hypothetical protein
MRREWRPPQGEEATAEEEAHVSHPTPRYGGDASLGNEKAESYMVVRAKGC